MTTSEKVARFKKLGYDATFSNDTEANAFGQLYLKLTGEKICLGCGDKTKLKFDQLLSFLGNCVCALIPRQFVLHAAIGPKIPKNSMQNETWL